MSKVKYFGEINRDIPVSKVRKTKVKEDNEELIKDTEVAEPEVPQEVMGEEVEIENQEQGTVEEKETNNDIDEEIEDVEKKEIQEMVNEPGAAELNNDPAEENKFIKSPENYNFNYGEYLKKDYGHGANDHSFDSLAEMTEAFLSSSETKKKNMKKKLEIIMKNFSESDRDSLWETFLKTEKEVGPIGSYLPPLPYEKDKQLHENKSNNSMVFLVILLLLLFD